MTATILDGNKIAGEIRAEVSAEAQSLSAAGLHPGLAVVLVGHNPASEIYVRGNISGEARPLLPPSFPICGCSSRSTRRVA